MVERWRVLKILTGARVGFGRGRSGGGVDRPPAAPAFCVVPRPLRDRGVVWGWLRLIRFGSEIVFGIECPPVGRSFRRGGAFRREIRALPMLDTPSEFLGCESFRMTLREVISITSEKLARSRNRPSDTLSSRHRRSPYCLMVFWTSSSRIHRAPPSSRRLLK